MKNEETMREKAVRISHSGQGAIVSEVLRLLAETETLKARTVRLNEIIEEIQCKSMKD
jgi:hypothetical protein